MRDKSQSRVVALVQARLGSTRLPGKVLRDVAGKPMLQRVVTRLKRSETLDDIVIATSELAADNPIAAFCIERGVACFRGSEQDVLDRFLHAAHAHQADVVVRITADCPLIDAGVVDEVVTSLLETPGVEYASNVLPRRTYPRGLDAEAFHVELLERLDREDRNPAWRQHVTEMVFQQTERFRIHNVVAAEDHSDLRWTVDTVNDLDLVCRIYDYFGDREVAWLDLARFIKDHPELRRLNAHVLQKAPF